MEIEQVIGSEYTFIVNINVYPFMHGSYKFCPIFPLMISQREIESMVAELLTLRG